MEYNDVARFGTIIRWMNFPHENGQLKIRFFITLAAPEGCLFLVTTTTVGMEKFGEPGMERKYQVLLLKASTKLREDCIVDFSLPTTFKEFPKEAILEAMDKGDISIIGTLFTQQELNKKLKDIYNKLKKAYEDEKNKVSLGTLKIVQASYTLHGISVCLPADGDC